MIITIVILLLRTCGRDLNDGEKKTRRYAHAYTHADSGGGDCTARVWDGFLAPYGEATAAINRVLILPYGLLLCTHRYII